MNTTKCNVCRDTGVYCCGLTIIGEIGEGRTITMKYTPCNFCGSTIEEGTPEFLQAIANWQEAWKHD